MIFEKEQKEKLEQVLNDKQIEYYGLLLEDIKTAQDARDQSHPEFDNMTYYEDYLSNKRVANTYLKPIKNKTEVEINTGTTEKKIESVFNSILQFNYQPTVFAFDDNDTELGDLGDDLADIVKRTNEIEHDDDTYKDALREMLTQRIVYMEEYFDDGLCKKKLLNGLQIYLGDITLPYYRFQEQPFIIKYDRMQYDVAEKIYSKNENWQYVSKGVKETENGFDYRMHKTLPDNEVEIITYTNALKKHQQILINGVMMNDIEAGLPYKHKGYNIGATGSKIISGEFIYTRPLTSQSRALQSLNVEMIRLMIRKFQQGIAPPLGVRSGKVFSRDIWNPAAITQGLGERDFTKLTDHNGVNSGEFAMYQLIEQKIEEFIGAGNLQQGLKGQGKMTATETMMLQREGMKMLGILIYSWINLKREMTFLRIYNVLENNNKPVKKKYDNYSKTVYNIYKKFTIDDAYLEDNKIGKKIIQFTDQDITKEDNQRIYERELEEEEKGNVIRYKTMNIKKVNAIRKDFYIVIEPKEKEGSELKKAMFQEQINQVAGIMNLTGKKLNADKVIENFEKVWRVKDIFSKDDIQQPEQKENENEMNTILKNLEGMGGEVRKAGKQAEGGVRKPSLNTLSEQ